MSLTDNARRTAACANIPACGKALAGENLEWYPGAGEYCPECGEALTLLVPASPGSPSPADMSPADTLPPPEATAAPDQPKTAPDPSLRGTNIGYPAVRQRRSARFWLPLRWLWVVAAAFIVGASIFYTQSRAVGTDGRTTAARDLIAVCPISSAQQLAVDLVRGYAAKSAMPASRFVLTNAGTCSVRFSTAAEMPNAVIGRDAIVAVVNPLNPIARISENHLRDIFRGSIRDWSQLGGPRGAIVPVLTDPASDEAKSLASSLFFNVEIDRGVRRAGSSADVTRAVTGADRASRGAIGLVAFSQSVPAKVVPLAYLPAPSVLSIATRRYPYTLTVAIEPGSARSPSVAAAFIDYARSSDGAAIVTKNGLVASESR